MKSELKALLSESGMTIQEIMDNHIVLITSPGEPRPNKDTVLDHELIQAIIEDFGYGGMGRRMCYYDPESNSLKNGIHYRKRNDK